MDYDVKCKIGKIWGELTAVSTVPKEQNEKKHLNQYESFFF